MSWLRNIVTNSSRPNMGIETTNAVPFMSTTNCTAPPESPQNKTESFFGNNSGNSSTTNSNSTSPSNSQESLSFRTYNRQNSDPLHILVANSDKRK